LAGFFGGLSYLTRYNGIFLLSFVVVIMLINFWNLSWAKRIIASAVFIVVFVLTFSPWGFYTLSEKGSFFYNENYKNIAYEMHGKGKISWDDFWFKESSKITSLADVVFQDISVFASKVINNIGNHFLSDMEKLMGWHVGVFVILGLIFLIIRNPVKYWKYRQTGYYIINLFFFGLLLLVFYSERFSLFLIPFYAVIAFHPFFSEKYKVRKFVPRKFGLLLVSVLIIFTFIKSYSFNSVNIDSGPKELLILRDWYNENVPPEERGARIAARKAHVAYYLDMEFRLLPMAEDYTEFLEKLQKEKIDYLYFSTIEAAMRRQFQFLLNPNRDHPGLEAVVYFEKPPAVLYRVLSGSKQWKK
jgi:4-amino-4-deoxy-L-arabinose transferase-like glycosyltransferase